MRVLIAAWSFPGHINPMMALARGLRERNHEVVFASGARARATVERQAFTFSSFRHVNENRVYEHVFSTRSRRMMTKTAVLREWLVETMPDQASDIREIAADWRPDVVVCDVTMWGPTLILREAEDLPVAV